MQIIRFNRVFHYKPSILGVKSPYSWKHMYIHLPWKSNSTTIFQRLVYEFHHFSSKSLSSSKRNPTNLFKMLVTTYPGFLHNTHTPDMVQGFFSRGEFSSAFSVQVGEAWRLLNLYFSSVFRVVKCSNICFSHRFYPQKRWCFVKVAFKELHCATRTTPIGYLRIFSGDLRWFQVGRFPARKGGFPATKGGFLKGNL